MPNWHDVLNEINRTQQERIVAANSTLDSIRRKYLRALAVLTGRNLIAYYSAFLTKTNVEGIDITDENKNSFMTCINGMDRSKGLDLMLHTPGGGIAATESLVHYLTQMFGRDIRAIVPQIAMSAGTMLSLSCKSVLMGKQSSLGPIDPQIAGIPADVVVTEFKRAYEEIRADPMKAHVWAPILSRYTPSFLSQCEYAVDWSAQFVKDSLKQNMLADDINKATVAQAIVDALSNAAVNKGHNKHIHSGQLRRLGVKVELLEDNQALQDAVLTVHHCYIHTLASTTTIKIVENDVGRAVVRHMAQPTGPQQISIGFGSPA
jgi:hypothetical protein